MPGPVKNPVGLRQYKPLAMFFSGVIDSSTVTAGVNSPSAAVSAPFNRVGISMDGRLEYVHLHQWVDGSSGTTDVEVWRARYTWPGPSASYTKIATVSLANGNGVDHIEAFTFVSDALRIVEAGDYLFLSPTSLMGGSPIHSVDIHLDAIL